MEGVLRGYDPFMNLVLDEGIEITKQGEKNQVGTTCAQSGSRRVFFVYFFFNVNFQIGMIVIRGNSVVMLDAKDRI